MNDVQRQLHALTRAQHRTVDTLRSERDALLATSKKWQQDDARARERLAQYQRSLQRCIARYKRLASRGT
jgi:hypothetical protein